MREKNTKENKGFTLIEVIIALAILSLVAVASMQLFVFSARSTERTKESTTSVYIARDAMEMTYDLSQKVNFQLGLEKMTSEKGYDRLSETEYTFSKLESGRHILITFSPSEDLINIIVEVYQGENLDAKMETFLIWGD